VQYRSKVFLDPATMSDLASVIDEFDRNHHLLNKYSAVIPPPERVLFEVTYEQLQKIAADSVTTLTGSVYDLEQFAKLSTTDFRNLFGDELAEQVSTGLQLDPAKVAELVGTLPRPDAVIFDDLMASQGLAPLAKEAESRTGLSFRELQQLAGG
jgi:hypothetical protein